jgi:hypothetical protein
VSYPRSHTNPQLSIIDERQALKNSETPILLAWEHITEQVFELISEFPYHEIKKKNRNGEACSRFTCIIKLRAAQRFLEQEIFPQNTPMYIKFPQID